MDTATLNLDIPPIETQRLTIRGLQPGDGAAFNAAIVESLPGLQQWLGIYKDGSPTVEETEALVRQKHGEFVAARLHFRQRNLSRAIPSCL